MFLDIKYFYYISLPYASFGIGCDNNLKVIYTAPIGKWMIGKDISFIQNWVKNKNGIIKEI